MSSDWTELFRELDDDQGDDASEWGELRSLDVDVTLAGWWRGRDEWQGDYGPTPVYLMTDAAGVAFYFYGGRKQLDRKIDAAAPNIGDRVAIRRLEDAPAEEGRNPAWRVRVAVRPGNGTIPIGGTEGEDGDMDAGIPF